MVLADAGPLYAAADPDDSLHNRSLEEQERLESEGLKIAVSYATLQETYGLVLRKPGLGRTSFFLEDVARTAIFVTFERSPMRLQSSNPVRVRQDSCETTGKERP